MRSRLVLAAFGTFVVTAFASADARAQPQTPALPSETVKPKTETTGKTDIAKGGFATSEAPAEDDPKEVTDLSIAGGGLLSAGNARTIALTTAGRLRLRRDEHQLSAAVAANFARAGKRDEPVETTVENYQGLLRYDYYLSDTVSLFLQSTGRRDRFQGLDLRLNVDPGVAYYFLNTKVHRLQVEGGYDLQHDIRRDAALVVPVADDAPPGSPAFVFLPKTQTLHNARLFAGYENKLRKEVSLLASVEYLQNFADIETYRLIVDLGLKTTVADNLAVATTYTARYENRPLPNVEKLDSIASFTLVYSFF